MFAIIKNTVIFFFLILFLPYELHGQYIPSDERGGAQYRRKAQMEGNQIRTTVFNYGMTGREAGVCRSMSKPRTNGLKIRVKFTLQWQE